MIYRSPVALLDEIGGGTLLAGTVPLPRIVRSYGMVKNSGALAIVSGGFTSGPTVTLNNIQAGDFVMLYGCAIGTKAATTGPVGLTFQYSGAATRDAVNFNPSPITYAPVTAAGGAADVTLAWMVGFTAAGSCDIALRLGNVAGGDWSIAIGGATMTYVLLAGV